MADAPGYTFATPDDFGDIQASELHTSLGERLQAQAGEAFMGGTRGLYRSLEYAQAGSNAPAPAPSTRWGAEQDAFTGTVFNAAPPATEIPIDDAKAKVKQEGLEGHFKLPDAPTIKQPVLDLMIAHARERAQYDAAVSRGPQGFLRGALGFATEIGAGVVDPVNAAAFSIPVMGEARLGMILARAGGSVAARAGVRAGVGAAQGAVGSAALAPADWWLHTNDGLDYTMADALRSVVLGAGMGGAFHAGFGAFGDVRTRWRGMPLPGSPEDLLVRGLSGGLERPQAAGGPPGEAVEAISGEPGGTPPGIAPAAVAPGLSRRPPGIEAFHGTDKAFAEPDVAFGGLGSDVVPGAPGERNALFFTPDRDEARRFGSNVISRHIDMSNAGSFDAAALTRDPAFRDEMRAYLESIGQGKSWEDSLERLNTRKDAGGRPYPENFVRFDAAITGAIIRRARAQGLDVAVIKNMGESAQGAVDQYAVLNNKAMLARPGTGQGAAPEVVSRETGSHPALILADLPDRAREDVVRAATADAINGNLGRAGELLEEAAKADPRVAESMEREKIVAAAVQAPDNSIFSGITHGDAAEAAAAAKSGGQIPEAQPLIAGNKLSTSDLPLEGQIKQRPDWQRLADARQPEDADLAQASAEAERAPEPESVNPERAPSAAEAAAAEAEQLLADLLPRLSEEERTMFNDALSALDQDRAAQEQMVRDGAACLLEAAA